VNCLYFVCDLCAAWVNDAVITRDGSRAVTVAGDALARVWDVSTGKLDCCLEGHSDNIRSVVRVCVRACVVVCVGVCVMFQQVMQADLLS
jgi:WD40 repeat protein